jgi:hypothetical protein
MACAREGPIAGGDGAGGPLAQPVDTIVKASMDNRKRCRPGRGKKLLTFDESNPEWSRTANARTVSSAVLAIEPFYRQYQRNTNMGRGILLWMLGVPLPIILLLAMCSHS